MSALDVRVDSLGAEVPQPIALATPTSTTSALEPKNLDAIPRTSGETIALIATSKLVRRHFPREWNVAGAKHPATKKLRFVTRDPAQAQVSRVAVGRRVARNLAVREGPWPHLQMNGARAP